MTAMVPHSAANTPATLKTIPRITMERAEATEKFHEYAAHLRGKVQTEEDKAVLLGYKALSQGKDILNLHDVIRAGGFNPQLWPRLAVAGGDWKWCFARSTGQWLDFDGLDSASPWEKLSAKKRIRLPGNLVPRDGNGRREFSRIRALVPSVPPSLRPRWKLENYQILFEAVWEPTPPTDPILLRKLDCKAPLYVILAQWDLTELERAVLSGRFL